MTSPTAAMIAAFHRVADESVLPLLELARGIIGRGIEARQVLLNELAAE